jgi:probable HAF family extracellular repeat protein
VACIRSLISQALTQWFAGLSVILVALVVAPVQVHAAAAYTIVDLDTTPTVKPELTSNVNSRGQFCTGLSFHAFRYDDSTKTDLGTLGGTSAYAYGINDAGQVVGDSRLSGTMAATHAFRTGPNALINPATDDLGTLGGTRSCAFGINDAGQVVGYSALTGDAVGHAFRTSANAAINPAEDDLGTLGGTWSYAYDINASAQVVGYSRTNGDAAFHAFRTAGNAVIDPANDDLGTLGGTNGYAFAINASGQAVGRSQISGDGAYHAFRTASNAAINPATDDLGTLGGADSYAFDINSKGQVVGYSAVLGSSWMPHAFLYNGTTMIDLNSLIDPESGWILYQGTGINDAGQVVGCGLYGGTTHIFRLTPVPEPGSWAMLAGLASFGFLAAARRRIVKRP